MTFEKKLGVAQYLTRLFVAGVAGKCTDYVLVNHTNMNPDGLPVRLVSAGVGQTVSLQLEPHTDRVVAKAAEALVAHREAKQNSTPAS